MDELWLQAIYQNVFSEKMLPVYIPLLGMTAVSALSVIYLYCKNRNRQKGYIDVEQRP